MIYYNYSNYSGFELYDMVNDPEELTNLYSPDSPLSKQMKDELLQKVNDFNKPYQK